MLESIRCPLEAEKDCAMTATNLTIPKFANTIPRWQKASWDDYVAYRDAPNLDEVRLFFH